MREKGVRIYPESAKRRREEPSSSRKVTFTEANARESAGQHRLPGGSYAQTESRIVSGGVGPGYGRRHIQVIESGLSDWVGSSTGMLMPWDE